MFGGTRSMHKNIKNSMKAFTNISEDSRQLGRLVVHSERGENLRDLDVDAKVTLKKLFKE
jgi:hypothetical protein